MINECNGRSSVVTGSQTSDGTAAAVADVNVLNINSSQVYACNWIRHKSDNQLFGPICDCVL